MEPLHAQDARQVGQYRLPQFRQRFAREVAAAKMVWRATSARPT
ncbi:MAG TPA: hypothetical protein VGG75_33300 [Trebonia sp.]|jgi:hypothetical protein